MSGGLSDGRVCFGIQVGLTVNIILPESTRKDLTTQNTASLSNKLNASATTNFNHLRKCISYLTIENKGAIPDQYRAAMGNRIYGCDECQTVCPWNKKDWKPKGDRKFQ